jgi:hypothetical protein
MDMACVAAVWVVGNDEAYINRSFLNGRRGGLYSRPSTKMKNLHLTVLIAIAFLILSGTFAAAEDNEGYDANTELKLSGVVINISDNVRGPVIVRLKVKARIYDIHAGPRWFWDSVGSDIRVNTRVQVTGSKLIGRDGSLRIIGRNIKNLDTGRFIALRDESLTPVWRGENRRGRQLR